RYAGLSDSFRLERIPERVEELATLAAVYFRAAGDEAAVTMFMDLKTKAIKVRAENMGVPMKSLLANLELFAAHCGPAIHQSRSSTADLKNLRVERGGMSGWRIVFEDSDGNTQNVAIFKSDPKFGHQYSGHLGKASFYLTFVNDNRV